MPKTRKPLDPEARELVREAARLTRLLRTNEKNHDEHARARVEAFAAANDRGASYDVIGEACGILGQTVFKAVQRYRRNGG